jgi:hypothetical protein
VDKGVQTNNKMNSIDDMLDDVINNMTNMGLTDDDEHQLPSPVATNFTPEVVEEDPMVLNYLLSSTISRLDTVNLGHLPIKEYTLQDSEHENEGIHLLAMAKEAKRLCGARRTGPELLKLRYLMGYYLVEFIFNSVNEDKVIYGDIQRELGINRDECDKYECFCHLIDDFPKLYKSGMFYYIYLQ